MNPSASGSEAPERTPGIDWPRLTGLIRSHHRFLLTTHIRPDCDAIGSALGLAAILDSLGKDVRVVTAFDVPPTLRFLDPQHRIRRIGRDATLDRLADVEVMIVLDTSAWAQLGEMGDAIRATQALKLVLDHHVSSDDLGAEEFKDTSAEATGRIVFELAEHLGATVSSETATLLLAALATDTGWFRFSSTRAETLHLAGRLVGLGAAPDGLYKRLYENDSLARLNLVGRVLARATAEKDGRLIHTWIERADFEATGALPSDSEDLVNMTLTVGGTEVAVILVEQEGGGFKISFRSRSDVDCSKVASEFGGGGHRKAAGAFIREPLDVAKRRVLDAVRAAMG